MGRQQFSQPINVVSQQGKSVKFLSASSSLAILATTGVEKLYIYAPAKTIARAASVNVSLTSNPTATAGTKSWELLLENGGSQITVMKATGNWNEFNGLADSVISATTPIPTDVAAQGAAMANIWFDDATALVMRIENKTNADYTSYRYVNVMAVVEVVN